MRQKLFNSVLLIDDSDIDNRVNNIVILSSDFAKTVHMAKSANEGIEILKESASRGTHEIPEFIFLDLMMPEIDGFGFLELYAGLSETIKSISRIIVLTSSVDIIDYNRAISNPYVHNYLKKPLNKLELLALASHQSAAADKQ